MIKISDKELFTINLESNIEELGSTQSIYVDLLILFIIFKNQSVYPVVVSIPIVPVALSYVTPENSFRYSSNTIH